VVTGEGNEVRVSRHSPKKNLLVSSTQDTVQPHDAIPGRVPSGLCLVAVPPLVVYAQMSTKYRKLSSKVDGYGVTWHRREEDGNAR
jgi:hypothetical protein